MDEPLLLRREQLNAAGFSDTELRRLRRAGELTRIRRGTYLRGRPPDDETARHAAAARAALDRLADGAVCSHVTAAVLHGLPIWRIPLGRVHVTRPRRSGGRRTDGLAMHSAPLHPGEIELVAGLPVTSLARTVLDVARTSPFEESVVVADGARRGQTGREPVSAEALAESLRRAARWPGAPAARRVIAFADGRSESVGESRSRVALDRAGLPAPVLQWAVLDRTGQLIGYADFGWPERRTVGEFDGRIKYGRLLRPGQSPGDAVFAEKLREDRIRDEDLAVVRWTWPDLQNFAPVADRLRLRLAPRRPS